MFLPRPPRYERPDDIVSFVSDLSPNRVDTPQQGRRILTGLNTIFKAGTTRSEDIARIQNETLGFEKIFMVSLPERSDKRDAFSLQARLSNLSFEIVDGVVGSEVSVKALPYTMNLKPGQIGCWRAEMNIIQEMVAQNIQTALIFEDDADWDVGLRAQMTELAKGARWLSGKETEDNYPRSPYGDEWDLLWVGHCSTRPRNGDNRRWVIPKDPTVTPPDHRREFQKPPMERWETGPYADNQTRIVFVPEWGSCTAAYALSLRGAQKMLYRQSLLPFNNPIDDGMGHMCGGGVAEGIPFRCIAPFPSIVGVSRPAGGVNRASDINEDRPEDANVDVHSHSDGLVFPVRQNIERLLRQEEEFASEFPDVTGKTLNLANITSARGHGEYL
ncbi:glycosyltransferase family 34 protein, partial [Aureobasidium melanogenum]